MSYRRAFLYARIRDLAWQPDVDQRQGELNALVDAYVALVRRELTPWHERHPRLDRAYSAFVAPINWLAAKTFGRFTIFR